MTPHVVAAVFARGGSKGVPRKNIRMLRGKPLIAHAIDVARASSLVTRVVVSTEDPEIARVAAQYGAEIPFMRPAALAQDDSPEWLAWQHAIRELQADAGPRIDAFVSVPPTSPLRSVEDLNACIRLFLAGGTDVVVTVRPAERSPYFNMVTIDAQGYARLVIDPGRAMHRRQDAPTVYDMTTVAYVARPEFVLTAGSMFEGRVKAVVVPAERALDIDNELDFRIAECLMARGDT
jgi:N-acylneuraminate cytidylyltransferase